MTLREPSFCPPFGRPQVHGLDARFAAPSALAGVRAPNATTGDATAPGPLKKGALILNALLPDLLVINLLVEGIQIPALLARCPILYGAAAQRARSQRDLGKAYVVHGDMYIALRLQLGTKFFFLTYMYSSALPLLYLVGTAFMIVAPAVDRWNLLRVFETPPQTGIDLALGVVVIVMPLAIAR